MNETYRNWVKFNNEMRRRERVAYRLRFFAFTAAMLGVAAAVGAAVDRCGAAVLRYETQEQERMSAEYEAQMEAADAELLREIERSAGR